MTDLGYLLSEKVNFIAKKEKIIKNIKRGGAVHQENTAILNVHITKNGNVKYVRQKLMGETDKPTIIAVDLNTSLNN